MKPQPTTREQLEMAVLLLRRSRAFWRRGLVAFVVGALVAVAAVFLTQRTYRSETVILYQETIRRSDITGNESSAENARRVGARLREVLLSRATLEPIILDLGLYAEPGASLDAGELVEAVEDMRGAITFRAHEGDTFEIAFLGSSPVEAQEVTRRLAGSIIKYAADRRADQARVVKEFLDAESDRNKAELRILEADLAKFTAQNPLLAARVQGLLREPFGEGPGASPREGHGDRVLASLEYRAARIERRLHAAAGGEPLPQPVFQTPRESAELLAARIDLAEKLTRFTEKHPDVVAARNRLKVAEAMQSAAHNAAAAAFAAEQAALRAPVNDEEKAALERELADLRARIAARRAAAPTTADDARPSETPPAEIALEVELRRLLREVDEGRERQRHLEDKLFKAAITASSAMSDQNLQVSVLDPAYLPTAPASKPRSLLLSGFLALALLFGVAVAIVSAIVDERIYDRIDVERLHISLPVLAVIPKPRKIPALR